ncbi:MAG: hypothetical protein KDA79_02035 [Planctomycetaceae bacterium]|nr:hypothetical protein [Planctomycetaceae bacterium]
MTERTLPEPPDLVSHHMSTNLSDNRISSECHESFESMTPGEQLRGTLVLMLILLLALASRSL